MTNVGGTWKGLTDSVNVMAANLTLQVRTIAASTVRPLPIMLWREWEELIMVQTAVARGDLTQKIEGVSVSGEMLDLVDTINNMIDQLNIFAYVFTVVMCHVVRMVGLMGM